MLRSSSAELDFKEPSKYTVEAIAGKDCGITFFPNLIQVFFLLFNGNFPTCSKVGKVV